MYLCARAAFPPAPQADVQRMRDLNSRLKHQLAEQIEAAEQVGLGGSLVSAPAA